MTLAHRSVGTIQLPEVMSGKEEQLFLRELEQYSNTSRPQIVLDCSTVRHFNRAVVRLVLHALECALKRKGDVRLASLSAEGGAILESTGASRLFDVYDTVDEAVKSYHQIPGFVMMHEPASEMVSVSESVA